MDLEFGNEIPDLDVLIVGAGLSGLTSAVQILAKEHSLHIKILEQNSMPGGQIASHGKRFVNRDQTEFIDFMSQLNVVLRNYADPEEVRLKRCTDLDHGLLSVPAKFELRRYINMLELRKQDYRSLRYQLRKHVPTMERHICSNLFFTKSRQFMLNFVKLTSGLAADQINFDEFMCLCSSSGGLNIVLDLYLEMSSNLLEISCKTLVDTLLDKIQGVEIVCNVRAVEVKHFKDYVQVIDSNGGLYKTQTLILAISWDCVERIRFSPSIPEQLTAASKSNSKRGRNSVTHFYMRYNRSYWIHEGYSGQFLNLQPFVVGYELRPHEYCGYMLHEDDNNVRNTVCDLLSKYFGEEMADPLYYEEQNMELNGAVSKPLTKPWLRIIWSGSASAATKNRNLMGGAVGSGIRAAINALYVVRPQVVSWKDLSIVQDKRIYERENVSRITNLLSRVNLYNFSFYSLFVIGLVLLLDLSYG